MRKIREIERNQLYMTAPNDEASSEKDPILVNDFII